MPDERGPLREIAWRELCPWLLIFRSFRLAIQVAHLLLASLGVLCTIIGWWLLAVVFSSTDEKPLLDWLPSYKSCPWTSAAHVQAPPAAAVPERNRESGPRSMVIPEPSSQNNSARPTSTVPNAITISVPIVAPPEVSPPDLARANGNGPDLFDPAGKLGAPTLLPGSVLPARPSWPAGPPTLGNYPDNPWLGAWEQLRAPFRQLFNWRLGITGLAFLLLAAAWAAAVWALFGGVITRRAVLQLGREENIGLGAAVRYAVAKWRSYVAAPLLPLLGVALCAVPVWLTGLLMNVDVGVVLAGLMWPVLLVFGVLMALLLMALVFGWPLMWPTISAEGTDSFDALSRSWSYVYHRPLHYLFYAAVAVALGALGWLLAAYFAEWVVYLPLWTVTWATGNERIEQLFGLTGEAPGTLGLWGTNLIRFWIGCVRLLALGFVYSFFWSASSAIYLLLRRDDDGTDLDDVHVEPTDQEFGLPPLDKDAAGVPVVPRSEVGESEIGGDAAAESRETTAAAAPRLAQEPPMGLEPPVVADSPLPHTPDQPVP